jgi:hypothetical protein
MSVRVGGSTMVIAAWYAEHGEEAGVILLNDLALGEIFGGAGFEAKLHEQAFVNVHNLATPEELEAAAKPAEDTKVAAGPAVRAGSKKPGSNSNRNTKEKNDVGSGYDHPDEQAGRATARYGRPHR